MLQEITQFCYSGSLFIENRGTFSEQIVTILCQIAFVETKIHHFYENLSKGGWVYLSRRGDQSRMSTDNPIFLKILILNNYFWSYQLLFNIKISYNGRNTFSSCLCKMFYFLSLLMGKYSSKQALASTHGL
jgi:hypothetical protein